MFNVLKRSAAPELIFGLVAPIGVDLDIVVEALTEHLKEMDYATNLIRLTSLMKEVPTSISPPAPSYVASYRHRIAYANDVRKRLGDDALAAMAISAIRSHRAQEWDLKTDEERRDGLGEVGHAEETPLASQAYVIRQFKRPDEIRLLRSVYGRQFIVVSAYSPQETRLRRIRDLELRSHGGLISEVTAHNSAYELISQDAREIQDTHGQNVRDAFPLGDVFIDATSRQTCIDTLRRFIHLLFGSNEITPNHDEYGMYLAKSASLRSSDLSRQVGAAIFHPTGEVATLGCNEVPRAGGGTYWSGDAGDGRDFVQGHDPNESHKMTLIVDLLDRLAKGFHLSASLLEINDPHEVAKTLFLDSSENGVKESKIMDLLEFGRIIHAEMSAICDASRKGIRIQDTTLYVTAFPCHLCAKHIVASGILRVVYLEPYPKSYASALHDDSIEVEGGGQTKKVSFEPFKGVSPYRYRDLFEKGRRKFSGGVAQLWNQGQRRPMIEIYYPSYFQAELAIVGALAEGMEGLMPKEEQSSSASAR